MDHTCVLWLLTRPVEGHAHVNDLETLVELGGSLAYLKLGVIVVAVVAEMLWFMRDATWKRINPSAFAEQVAKLVKADNVERAIKLCGAMSSPLTTVARIGLEARLKGASARDAMSAVVPGALASARAGLIPVLMVSALGFVETGVLLAKGIEEGADSALLLVLGLALITIGGLAIRNGLRWGAWRAELAQITDAVVH